MKKTVRVRLYQNGYGEWQASFKLPWKWNYWRVVYNHYGEKIFKGTKDEIMLIVIKSITSSVVAHYQAHKRRSFQLVEQTAVEIEVDLD